MDANAVSVLDIFEKKHRLEIPLFQRQYVWKLEHQWAPLWEDISRKLTDYVTGRTDGPVHFLGAMVLDQKQTPTTHVDKRQVIDGQQRLTTLQIFLAALRDFCREQFCDVMDAGSRAALEKKHPLVKLPRRRKYEPRPRMVEAYVFFHSQIREFFLGTNEEKPTASETPLEERLDKSLH